MPAVAPSSPKPDGGFFFAMRSRHLKRDRLLPPAVVNSGVRPVRHPLERQRGVGVIHDCRREEPIMDREHIKGAADKIKGPARTQPAR